MGAGSEAVGTPEESDSVRFSSVSVAEMMDRLAYIVGVLLEDGAPRQQTRKAEAALDAITAFYYCVKPDCPECMNTRKKKILKGGK